MREFWFWVKLLGLGALLGATTFFGVMRVSLRGGVVTMPDLRGLPKASAEARLRSLRLDMSVREERYSSAAPYGAVIEQSLEPGVTLKRGRDIAVVVSESVTHADLMARVWGADTGGLLRNALLFDVYRPKPQKSGEEAVGGLAAGEKSVAVRLMLNSAEVSLTEAQIEAAVQAVVAQLASHLGARLRA